MKEKPEILVVEDESIVAIEIESRLKKLDFNVCGRLSSGEAAVEKVDSLLPDLILMDIHLQGEMDGIDAAGMIREKHDIPVIYLTAYADKDTLDRAKSTRPAGYILKPFEGRELKVTIETALYKHQMESRIRKQQERFQTIYNASPIGIIVLDDQGCLIEMNQSARQMLELTRIGFEDNPCDFFEFLQLSDENRVLLEQNEDIHYQTRLTAVGKSSERESGNTVFIDVLMSAISETIRIDNEKYLIHIQDISKEVQAQKAVEESKNLFQTLIESLPQAVVCKDLDGEIIFANQYFCNMTGLERDDIIGKTDFDLSPEHLAQKYVSDDKTVIETRQFMECVEEHQNKNGSSVFVQTIKTPLLNGDNNVVGVMAILWDVTEKKKMEELLAQEKELLSALMDNMPDTIYFKDLDSRFIRINKSQAKLLGLDNAEKALGKTDHDFFEKDHADWALADEQRIIETGEPLLGKMERICRASGFCHWVMTSKVPIRNADNEITGIVGITRDISDLKKVEEQLKRSNTELEQFAYIASHDLQEPLRMVASYVQLLERRYQDKFDEDGKEFIQFAVDGARRMQGLIHDLLLYSRVGTKGADFEDVDTNQILEAVTRDLQIMIQERNAKIDIGPMPVIHGDKRQIGQLFQNMITNAIKFCKEDQPHVKIACREKKTEYVFSVQDNGIGIEPEFHERIFLIFQRLHKRDDFEGTGIGLAICKKIVERHGGTIRIESEAGKGTTFIFSFKKSG